MFRSTPLREGRQKWIRQFSPPQCFDPRPCARGDQLTASERSPAPARSKSRAMTSKSVGSRDRRSAAGIITTSPASIASSSRFSCGRSAVAPLSFSRKILVHPAAVSWASWLARSGHRRRDRSHAHRPRTSSKSLILDRRDFAVQATLAESQLDYSSRQRPNSFLSSFLARSNTRLRSSERFFPARFM
jgi:hypothetical protein